MNLHPRFYSLWSINGPLDQPRLRRQLDQFKAAGLDGVVFHPRFYPNHPPYLGNHYLQVVSDTILYAKGVGLGFWLYDEDGWPSGTVGGQLLKQFPQDAQHWAELVPERPECCLAAFEQDGKKWFVADRLGTGVDYLNPDLARHFLALTHERYRAGLAPAAWEHVGAIFCDEPEFGLGHAFELLSRQGAIPWTPKLPELFRQRYGEDLLPLLPRLFLPAAEDGETRVKFWELLTDVFNESFTAPINDWCRRQGKRFTAHVKGEEHPLFQVPTSGSCHQFFRNLSLPGIDALERFPGNDFYPRQVASAAQQFGDGRCMVEVFGGAGWGASPEDLERDLLWLGRHGLTDFVLHLSQYQLTSAAICDWPPSQPLHVNWASTYPELLRRVREELRQNPPPPADTLLVAPYRGIMAAYEPRELLGSNVHNAATYPDSTAGRLNRGFLEQVRELHEAGIAYHLADERTLEEFGRSDPRGVRVGNCIYQRVMVAEGARINGPGCLLLASSVVISADALPLPSRGVKVGPPPVVAEPVAVAWTLRSEPANALLLEPVSLPGGWFVCELVLDADLAANPPLEVFFADAVAELTLNDHPLRLLSCENGVAASLAEMPVAPVNHLRFRYESEVHLPFVWLQGGFRAVSQTPYQSGPNKTLVTAGPFRLGSPGEALGNDLVPAGFPFLRAPLSVETHFQTSMPAHGLQLCGVQANAARISLNGVDLGWTWGPDWNVAVNLAPGTQTLCLELIPSTYNYFGPHHYFAGDRHVISPDQFTGRRNFADPTDAPVNTRVSAWHFRRFQLPVAIALRP